MFPKPESSFENNCRPSGCKRPLDCSADVPSSFSKTDDVSCSMEISTSGDSSDVAKRNRTAADMSGILVNPLQLQEGELCVLYQLPGMSCIKTN